VTYLFTLDDYWTLDGAVGGSGAEIINHSCDPNLYSCIMRPHPVPQQADHQTGRGTDRGLPVLEGIERVRCRCGAPACRGTINLA